MFYNVSINYVIANKVDIHYTLLKSKLLKYII